MANLSTRQGAVNSATHVKPVIGRASRLFTSPPSAVPLMAIECHCACRSPAPMSGRARDVAVSAAVQGGSNRRGSRSKAASRSRGFGSKQSQADDIQARQDLAPLDADDVADSASGPNIRTEYQLYTDAGYKPQRYIGPVQVKPVEGQGLGLVANEDLETGTLVVLSPALTTLEGEFMAAPPEAEELHMSWVEEGVTAAQRRVLDQLYDGTDRPNREVSLPTLDVKFWLSRGKHDPQAPQVSSGRLLSIIQNGACADSLQDASAMTMRHQKPSSFIGLWPEYTFLNHSCVPNTSITVIQDRMLIHCAASTSAGEQLTRNYIPSVGTAPAPQRQAALKEAGYDFTCNCPRCRLEQQVSQETQDVLQAAYQWYTNEALPRFNAANQGEDLQPLMELYEEAEALVQEIEDAVEAEEGLDDIQRTLLRASAYDTYDMLLMCDEFVHQERTAPGLLLCCLELVNMVAPGSESHTAVALKYDRLCQQRQQMMETLLKQGRVPRNRANLSELKRLNGESERSGEYKIMAWVARYGYINFATIEALTDAYEVYVEACEQMSIMQYEGQSEAVSEMEINGVKVSLVDKADLEHGQEGIAVSNGSGVRLTVMEDSTQGALLGGPTEQWSDSQEQGLTWPVEAHDVVDGPVVDVEAEALDVIPQQVAATAVAGPQEGDGQDKPARKPRVKRKQL